MPRRIGIYLATVQFAFAACWTVYVIFLPQLAAQAGIPKTAVIWILMMDQLIFLFTDYAMGVASDRAARATQRLGPWILGVTLVSCLLFRALPFIAPPGASALFLVVVALWSASSSALRAPPMTLVGRHAAKPSQPWLVSMSMLGLGIAGAVSPYLGLVMKGVDPRVPFVVSSVVLALVTVGIVAAERALEKAGRPVEPASVKAPAAVKPSATVFLFAAVGVALAFQVHVFLNSGTQYQRFATAADLPLLLPVFWIGFNLGVLPGGWAARHWGGVRVMAAGGVLAAIAAAASENAGSLAMLITAQFAAGVAWAAVISSAFSTALALGHTGREGRFSGALSSVLALGALMRMAVLAFGLQRTPEGAGLLGWTPVAGWLVAGLLLLVVRSRPPVLVAAGRR